jgi:hypothetical protein
VSEDFRFEGASALRLELIDIVNRTCTDRQSASRLNRLTPRIGSAVPRKIAADPGACIRPAEAERIESDKHQDRIEAEIVSFNVNPDGAPRTSKSVGARAGPGVCNRSDTGAFSCVRRFLSNKRLKGIRWMPWHRKAMKDVAPCEKLRGGGSNL